MADDDDMIGVSGKLYDTKLEIVVSTSPAHVPRDDRKYMRWYMPDKREGEQTSALISLIGKHTRSNYTTVQSTALSKGLSTFFHKFGNDMLILEQMQEAGLYLDNSGYYRLRRSHVITIGNMPENESKVITDEITYAQIKQHALLLKVGLIQFTSILMLYALTDSDIIPGHLKQTYQEFVDEFEACMVIFFHSMGIERVAPEPGIIQDAVYGIREDPDTRLE